MAGHNKNGIHIGNLPKPHLFHSFSEVRSIHYFSVTFFSYFFLQEILAVNATTQWPLFNISAFALFGQQTVALLSIITVALLHNTQDQKGKGTFYKFNAFESTN